MYRQGSEYDEIAKKVIEIYIDYDFDEFPIKAQVVCNRICIELVPYSHFDEKERILLLKRSKYGFSYAKKFYPIIVFYDSLSDLKSIGCIRTTVFHEIKHIVYADSEEFPEDDDLADYFAKYFMCPIPYLIAKEIYEVNDIVENFNVSYEMAKYISSSIKKRINKYGNKIFDYERSLINMLLPNYIFKD
ncbi:MAG: hypothetical protein Q4D21_03695 [Phascolarctobacterium sp.]|nr:hypothetical protein [Phascolarctobacterium sp.]